MQRHAPIEQRRPDHLVDRIVPADVLAHVEQRTGRVEQARRVEAPGLFEHRLRGPDLLRHAQDRRGGKRELTAREPGTALHLDGLDRPLPAYAAAGRHVEVAGQRRRIDRVSKGDRHDIVFLRADVPAVPQVDDRAAITDQPLTEQESGHEQEVVTRRPHGDRNRDLRAASLGPPPLGPASRCATTRRRNVQPNLHRLLHRHGVLPSIPFPGLVAGYADPGGAAFRSLGHWSPLVLRGCPGGCPGSWLGVTGSRA